MAVVRFVVVRFVVDADSERFRGSRSMGVVTLLP